MRMVIYATLNWKQGRSPKMCWECPIINRKICLPGTQHIRCDRHGKAKVIMEKWMGLGTESEAREFHAKGKLKF